MYILEQGVQGRVTYILCIIASHALLGGGVQGRVKGLKGCKFEKLEF